MTRRPRTVAVMQPYFVPYAGYFRLLATADVFVVYDCVQFPRRGWVHRNRLMNANGELRWLTLPIDRAPRDALIRHLRFAPDAARRFVEQKRTFPILERPAPDRFELLDALGDFSGSPLDYIERLIARCAAGLGLPWNAVRSSSLEIPREISGEARILEILRLTGAERYVNSPGGRALYDTRTFDSRGIDLRYLLPYRGSSLSILARMLDEPERAIAEEIRANLELVP